MEIKEYKLQGNFFRMRGFYYMYRPLFVPYSKIYEVANYFGLTPVEKSDLFMVERGVMFGFGWIGIEVVEDDRINKDILYIDDTYKSFLHKGAYNKIGETYKEVMKSCPGKDYLNVYVNSPENTKRDSLKTLILFKDL